MPSPPFSRAIQNSSPHLWLHSASLVARPRVICACGWCSSRKDVDPGGYAYRVVQSSPVWGGRDKGEGMYLKLDGGAVLETRWLKKQAPKFPGKGPRGDDLT